jgi:phosphatidylinositol-3-phosphatase
MAGAGAAIGSVLAVSAATGSASTPKILVIMMENHGDGSIIGNSAAPFQNSLATNYATFTNSAGVDHPSAPNYVAFVSGQDNGSTGAGDCSASIGSSCNWSGANLGVQLRQAGISNAWYAEGLSGNGCSISNSSSGDGDINHMPWAYMDTWQANAAACANAGLTTTAPSDPQLISALSSTNPPSFAWVTPNLTDDTHDGTIAQGDTYLKNLVTAVQGTTWYASGGTILVTYDEDEGETDAPGYCTNPVFYGGNNSNCITTLAVSNADAGVGAVSTPLDHFGVLGSIEKCYGLTQMADAANLATYGDITSQLCPSRVLPPPTTTTTAARWWRWW